MVLVQMLFSWKIKYLSSWIHQGWNQCSLPHHHNAGRGICIDWSMHTAENHQNTLSWLKQEVAELLLPASYLFPLLKSYQKTWCLLWHMSLHLCHHYKLLPTQNPSVFTSLVALLSRQVSKHRAQVVQKLQSPMPYLWQGECVSLKYWDSSCKIPVKS